MKILNNKGFGHIEVLIVVIVICLISVAGLFVYKSNKSKQNMQNSQNFINKEEFTAQPAIASGKKMTVKNEGEEFRPETDTIENANFDEKEYGFSFKYSDTFVADSCILEFDDGSKYAGVSMSVDGSSYSCYSDEPQPKEIRIVLSSYFNYQEQFPGDWRKEAVQSDEYARIIDHKMVEINGKQMQRRKMVFTGEGSLVEKGSITVDYTWVNSDGSRAFVASYDQDIGSTDYLSEFEEMVKTIFIKE